MALVWEKRVKDSHYQVRRHGASIRLYSNGVFHSQWNPRDPLKGSLWELLLLPAFFLPAGHPRSVLVLGVGGGAVIKLLQRYLDPEVIVGVELDRTHLQVARNHFGVRGADLICADAQDFVREADGEQKFDLIIDDLFGHADGEASRAVTADEPWCRALLKLLSPDGVVVSNFAGPRELAASGWRQPPISSAMKGRWRLTLPGYENEILAVSRAPLLLRSLKARAPAAINPANPACRLDCHFRRLA